MKGKKGEAREERAILITGCDSGFGFDLAMALAAESLACREEEKKEGRREEPRGRRWKVYAGCLSATGREQITQRAPEAAAHGKAHYLSELFLVSSLFCHAWPAFFPLLPRLASLPL